MTKNRAPFYLLLFPSERERNATVVSVITPLMHRVVKPRNQRESASLDREIKEEMETRCDPDGYQTAPVRQSKSAALPRSG